MGGVDYQTWTGLGQLKADFAYVRVCGRYQSEVHGKMWMHLNRGGHLE
jgi:hypothetical protein